MPPIAQLLDDLERAINSAAGQSALGGQCPAKRGYQESQPQTAQGSARVWLSPEGWRDIGRCGGLTLEQHTVDVRFQRIQPTPDNVAIDEDIDTACKLRTFLRDFVGLHGGRVSNILGPLTIDRQKLTFPGQSSIGLSLDCEILTGEATADADPEEPARLTVARNAVWSAIDNWEPLIGTEEAPVFARKYKATADIAELQLRDPTSHELPAIALYWGDVKPEWRQNRMQEWPLTLRMTVWLPGDRHTYAETLLEHVFDAIYRAKSEGDTLPCIERATGYPPRRVNELTIQSVVLGRAQQVRALRADVAFALRSNKDPFGDE